MLAASQPHPSQKWPGTSRPGMARYISAASQPHPSQEMAEYISARNGQVHLGQPHSFFPSYSILHISASCFTSFTTRLRGLVLVYGRVHPGPIRQKWLGSPRPKYETYSLWPSHWVTCFSPFLQHNTEGPISVMVEYIPAPFGRVHPDPREWQIEHVIMAQRYKGAAPNLSQKGRSWYLAKYRRANPKKGRIDMSKWVNPAHTGWLTTSRVQNEWTQPGSLSSEPEIL